MGSSAPTTDSLLFPKPLARAEADRLVRWYGDHNTVPRMLTVIVGYVLTLPRLEARHFVRVVLGTWQEQTSRARLK
jgi:hypothetical protein